MVSFEHAAAQLKVVWDMVFYRTPSERLDQTEQSVFNSFWAAAFTIFPALFIYAVVRDSVSKAKDIPGADRLLEIPAPVYYFTQTSSMLIAWGLSLVALGLALTNIGARQKFASLVIAFNWSNLLGVLLAATPCFLYVATQSHEFLSLGMLMVFGLNFFIIWRILRIIVDVDVGVTIALIIVLLLIEFLVDGIFTALVSLFI